MLEIAFGTYCITAVRMATRLLPAPSDVKVLFLFVARQCIPVHAVGFFSIITWTIDQSGNCNQSRDAHIQAAK